MAQYDTFTLLLDWVSRGSSKRYPTVHKYTVTANIEKDNPENLNLQLASLYRTSTPLLALTT